ncbi:hypothetical protein HPP92_028379 [Vanilla planifolia]|uniref:Regulatory particle non-ATPase 13 n=1 Tax=Vanilla planifolia TaxID=51239 RepID=A0A835P7L7_VANPL|nr:hypothetical protein HPP92_028379 [Vanilla planifolia]KAG0447444.1 hypothetical protein HPP92_028347 [Vanilla planifolia]
MVFVTMEFRYYVAPSGKRLRSMVELQRYLEEHPEYSRQGVKVSQFSFQIPRPLHGNYVRKRTGRPLYSGDKDGSALRRHSEPIEAHPLSWVAPIAVGEEVAESMPTSSLVPSHGRKRVSKEQVRRRTAKKLIESGSGSMGSPTMEVLAPLQDVMLEFRAGKMFLDGTRVIPDTRKGLVRIGRGEEGLIHFQWLDRTQNVVEDDQIIFPDEAVFEKVAQSSGRVYILKFNSDNRKFFFWMQEPKSDGDVQICNSVNSCINRPLDIIGEEEAEASVPMHTSEISEDTADDDISSRAGNLVDQNMPGELTGEVTSSAGPVKLADLQRILRSIQTPDAIADPDAGIGLGDILKPELLLPVVESLSLEQRLASFLPEGQWSSHELMDLLQSPPFQQQVDSFSHVLRTGQLDLSQFGVNPSKYKFTVLSFLEALEDTVAESLESDEGSRPDESKDVRPQRCNGDHMDES